MSSANEVIALARSQVGYKETGTNITKYASDFDNKYPDFYNYKKQGVAWCDMFFDWLLVTCFGMDEALRLTCQPKKSAGAGCLYSYRYYKAKGQVGTDPKMGAQIFFSKDKTEAGINHTGIVVSFDDSKVYTIEGNSDNQVKNHSYSRTNTKIYGYGYPAYDSSIDDVPAKSAVTETPTYYVVQTGDTLTKISLKYSISVDTIVKLNNIKDKNVIYPGQKLIVKPNSVTSEFEYKVRTNGSSLRIRSAPNINSNIVGYLQNGDEINIDNIVNGWGKISGRDGYSSMEYIVKNN